MREGGREDPFGLFDLRGWQGRLSVESGLSFQDFGSRKQLYSTLKVTTHPILHFLCIFRQPYFNTTSNTNNNISKYYSILPTHPASVQVREEGALKTDPTLPHEEQTSIHFCLHSPLSLSPPFSVSTYAHGLCMTPCFLSHFFGLIALGKSCGLDPIP